MRYSACAGRMLEYSMKAGRRCCLRTRWGAGDLRALRCTREMEGLWEVVRDTRRKRLEAEEERERRKAAKANKGKGKQVVKGEAGAKERRRARSYVVSIQTADRVHVD